MKLVKLRSKRATVTLDLVGGFVILVPLALLAVNIGYLAVGTFINDAACREAARVAASQSSITNAYAAATTAVRSFAAQSGAIGSPQVTSLSFNYVMNQQTQLPIDVTSLDSTNLAQAPNVQVSTSLIAATPAPLLFNGTSLTSQVTLNSTYTFPILYSIDPDPNNTASDTGTDNGFSNITETITTPPDGTAP